jgi:hypothetical protein
VKGPTLVIDGATFPVSTAPDVPDGSLRYVKLPTTSWDWQGAQWDGPVSLTFTTEVARAEVFGTTATVHTLHGFDQDAQVALMVIRKALRDLSSRVIAADKLVDRRERVRILVTEGRISFRAKVWPAIAGVTYRGIEDSTI